MFNFGKDSGIVANLGCSSLMVVPVHRGKIIPNTYCRHDRGGDSITDLLLKCLTERGYNFNTSFEARFINGIKEKMCYVANDYDKELKKFFKMMIN